MPTDNDWMEQALAQAKIAAANNEVPVGAVVVYQGQVIGVGANSPIGQSDPTAHAEIKALRQAAATVNNYRLNGCSLYVTLEPCLMCAGSMVHARIDRLVYGASDPKTGVAGSRGNILDAEFLNHSIKVTDGVMAEPCAQLLREFFRARR